tara:strand:+ start:30 stop:329 length:300 start_codon:yes stop_codon:yes gene_type:complete
VKALLAILSLPLLLVLSSCGDSDDPTRGIEEGFQVLYCWKGEEDRVLGVKDPLWLSDKTKSSFTVRTSNGEEDTYSKSELLWMEEVIMREPMPKREGEE